MSEQKDRDSDAVEDIEAPVETDSDAVEDIEAPVEADSHAVEDIEAPVEDDLKPFARDDLIVVGVGASAGGLEALQALLSNLPSNTNMSFVVAQHLSPSYKSMMVDLLVKDSTIPVMAASHGEKLRANCVYICPPNFNIEIGQGDIIQLTNYAEILHTPRPSVDMLFESIATVKGDQAIGVILSGTGSDGARGIRTIKGENGLGIVQDPSTAKYDGMPNAAINSGNVDLILPASMIGEELKNILSFPINPLSDSQTAIPPDVYNSIIRLLKMHCKVDFSLYKDSTILRRIERRMASLKISKSNDYLEAMLANPDEVTFLFNDMLIGVTSFFRDARAFEVLKTELTTYIKNKEDKSLRIWSVASSTGEEAYSIAMLLTEILGKDISEYKIQIFATDIDSRAIATARNATYPEAALQKLPKTLRQKYFTVKNDQFQVIKPITSMVIFSIQDVNKDPPFLRLDLITCRNVMIYFTLELQRLLLPVFHYALNPRGLLMLGQSESIGVFQEQYRPLSKSGKIYEAVYVGKKLPPERNIRRRLVEDMVDNSSEKLDMPQPKTAAASMDTVLSDLVAKRLRELVLPNAILLNENNDIIFTYGKNPLLTRPEGIATNSIYKNMSPQFSIDLRSALHNLEKGEEFTSTAYQNIEIDGNAIWVKLVLAKIHQDAPRGSLTLLFTMFEEEHNLPVRGANYEGDNAGLIALEQQRLLAKTKDQLQDVIEELEASNEEMQSLNEEMQSSNEELQSSNEELETTNEELQSTNEELQTAYAELRMAYEEKDHQQSELFDLRTEIEQANSLLEEAERIGKTGTWLWHIPTRKLTWSNGCYSLYDLDKQDFHPSFQAFIGLAHPDDRNRLEQHLKDLLVGKARQPFVFKAESANKEVRFISIEAVVSFNDLKQATKVMGSMKDVTQVAFFEDSQTAHRDKISYLLKNSVNGVYIYNIETGKLEYANPVFVEVLHQTASDINRADDIFAELFHKSDMDEVKQLFNRVRDGKFGQNFPGSYRLRGSSADALTFVHANHTAFEVDDDSGKPKQILATFVAVET